MFSIQRMRALLPPCALGVALLCGTPSPAGAQTAPTPAPSTSSLPEIGTVTTSDRHSEPLARTTHPTFVVDRNTIENFGSRTVGDALANVPGMNVFSYGTFGAQNNYGIRGTTSAETLVLQDGVPIATGSNGTVDLGSLSTIGVQRIEVVESGSSTLYGSGATGGVINIITSIGAQPYFRIADGTFGNRDLAAQAGTGNLAVSYERHIATNVYDYPAFSYPGGNATPAGTRANADAEQTVARISYFAQLGGGWTARLAADDNAIDIGVPGGLSFLTPFARQGTNRTDGLLEASHAAGAGTFDVTLSAVGQRLTFRDTLADLTGFGSGIDEQDTYDGRTQASLRYTLTGKPFDLVAGADLSRETALLSFPPSTPAQPVLGVAESQAAVYAQASYNAGSAVRLIFGLRGENDAPRGSVIAPAFGTTVQFGAARFTGNVSESFRVPTLIDLYFPGFSNPNLLPEKFSNYDATLAFPQAGGGISVGYFGRNGANLIVLDPATFIPFNASRVAVNGLQFTAATLPMNHLRLSASLTDLYRAIDTTTGLRLPSTPPIVAALGIERPFDAGRLAFGAHFRIFGSTSDVPNFSGGPPLADPFNGYASADAYVRYRASDRAILTVRGSNLGDTRYAPIFGYPAPGRSIEIELATR
jgi:vitamin B12 transporter